MSDYETFVAKTRAQLDSMGDELNELEAKVKSAGREADDWSRDQLAKLKADWSKAKSNVDRVAQEHREEIEASWAQVKSDAENHWNALQAAVSTYRMHVEKNISSAQG
ncbi:MAG: hypothetical protein ACR2OX_01805 [Methyloligellaceae bacterium]